MHKELMEQDKTLEVRRSSEYGSLIIHSLETGTPRVIYGNVPNHGLIDNLPEGCCVEVPCLVDKSGVQPTRVGALPPQCVALNMTNINVQGLGVKAAMNADPELVVATAALDPLTSTQCTLNEVREMCAEMLEAQRQWLPAFEGKTIKKTPVINIPKDVKRADVPVDPALAIMARFGELGK
jgi:alpha-galactosidase